MTELQELNQKVREIHIALMGNPNLKQEGMFQKLERIEQNELKQDSRIHSIEKLMDRAKWFLVGGVIAGGYGTWEFLNKFVFG